MSKALGSIPNKRKVPLVSASLLVEALRERVGEAEPNLTSHLFPPCHPTGPLQARAASIGGPQPLTVLENTQFFPFNFPVLLGNAGFLFSKENRDQRSTGWEACLCPLSQCAG